MLKEIIAITGKPGLYKIIAHNGRTLIVEELGTGKRMPVSMRDKVVSLGDIAMYTEEDDKPLGEILDNIYVKEEGKNLDVKKIIAGEGLKGRFALYEPTFDRERVHDSDIKKLFSWYNILTANGFTKFTEEEKKGDKEGEQNLTTKPAKASEKEAEKATDKKDEK